MKLPRKRKTSNPTIVSRRTRSTDYVDSLDGGSAIKDGAEIRDRLDRGNKTGKKRRGKGKWK